MYKISKPTLTIFPADKQKAASACVIICPGGEYAVNAMNYEGTDVARQFAKMGVTAAVLKYRIPDDGTMVNKKNWPLQDAQRALQLVRERAATFGINPHMVGIMGFSAGGPTWPSRRAHILKPRL